MSQFLFRSQCVASFVLGSIHRILRPTFHGAEQLAHVVAKHPNITHVELDSVPSDSIAVIQIFLEELSSSVSLKTLTLKEFRGEEMQWVAPFLAKTRSLQHISIEFSLSLTSERRHADALWLGLEKNKSIKTFEVMCADDWILQAVLMGLLEHSLCSSLITVHIRPLSVDCLQQLTQLLHQNTTLQSLRWSSAMYGGIPVICQALQHHNTTLSTLDLSMSTLTIADADHLRALLERTKTLHSLKMNNCTLLEGQFVRLARGLERNTSVKIFDISGIDHHGEMTVEQTARLLRDVLLHNRTIETLDMSANHFTSPDVARLIRDGIMGNGFTLRDLNLSGNGFTEAALDILAECLTTEHSNLDTLQMRNIRLHRRFLMQLLQGTRLQMLDVSGCNIDETGAYLLSLVLRDPVCTFLELVMRLNSIQHEGLKAICEALETNASLERLVLSEYALDDVGVEILAKSLPNMQSLKKLEFTWQSRTKEMTRCFLDALKKNTSLLHLDIDHRFGPGGWDNEISFYLLRNRYRPLVHSKEDVVARSTWPGILKRLAGHDRSSLSLMHTIIRDKELYSAVEIY